MMHFPLWRDLRSAALRLHCLSPHCPHARRTTVRRPPHTSSPQKKTAKKTAISWRYCKKCVALHSQQQAAAVGGLLPPPERRGATFGKLSSTEFWQIYVTLIICKDVHAIGIAFCTETKEQKKISSGVDFTCYTLQVLPEPQLSNGLSIHATLFNPRDFAEHIPFEATPTLSTRGWHSIESNGSKTAMKHDFGLHPTHALS